MRTSHYHTIRVALLSFFIAVSFLTTGGWFCADGQACMPATSATCCCATDHGMTAASARPARDAPHGPTCLAAHGCGCYRELCPPAALGSQLRVAVLPPAVLPGPRLELPEPAGHRGSHRPVVISVSRPRFLVSPRDTRAPPAA